MSDVNNGVNQGSVEIVKNNIHYGNAKYLESLEKDDVQDRTSSEVTFFF